MSKQEIFTSEEFEALTDYQKGYVVYMMGSCDDQPNVPETYECDTKEYADGEFWAMLDVTDSEGQIKADILELDLYMGWHHEIIAELEKEGVTTESQARTAIKGASLRKLGDVGKSIRNTSSKTPRG